MERFEGCEYFCELLKRHFLSNSCCFFLNPHNRQGPLHFAEFRLILVDRMFQHTELWGSLRERTSRGKWQTLVSAAWGDLDQMASPVLQMHFTFFPFCCWRTAGPELIGPYRTRSVHRWWLCRLQHLQWALIQPGRSASSYCFLLLQADVVSLQRNQLMKIWFWIRSFLESFISLTGIASGIGELYLFLQSSTEMNDSGTPLTVFL